MGFRRCPALARSCLICWSLTHVADAQVCAEPGVQDVCNCGAHSMWAGSKCNDCKDKSFWGYGCDLPCNMTRCPLGCDFIGRCYNPHAENCKHMVRIDDGTGEEEKVNDRGECQHCKDGKFWGDHCEFPCGPRSGMHCKSSVEGYCTRAGECFSCLTGWFGENCTRECPAACQECVQKDGLVRLDGDEFMPAGSCLGHCQGNMWGMDCSRPCPATCKSFPPEHRFGSRATCQKNDGHCLMCGGSFLKPLRPYNRVNLTHKFITAGARSAMKITGKYYYEVQLHFGPRYPGDPRARMEVGWASTEFELVDEFRVDNGIGNSPYGWASDGFKNATYLAGVTDRSHLQRSWKEGDVIGLAFDIDAPNMSVSLNGEFIDWWKKVVAPKGTSFYPAISTSGPYTMSIGASTWRYAPPSDDFQEWAPVDHFNRPDRIATTSCVDKVPEVGDSVVHYTGAPIPFFDFALTNDEIATVVAVDGDRMILKNTAGQMSPSVGWELKYFKYVDHEDHRWWGPRCEHSCPEGCKGGICERDDGACSEGCEQGFYGLPNCSGTCGTHCEGGDCFDTGPSAGECRQITNGRPYIGACERGYWGMDCNLPCPEDTLDVCDQFTGKPAACKGNQFPEIHSDEDGVGIYQVVAQSGVQVYTNSNPHSTKYATKLPYGAYLNVSLIATPDVGVPMLRYIRNFKSIGPDPFWSGSVHETWVPLKDGNGQINLKKWPTASCVPCPADCLEKAAVTDHETILSDGSADRPHCTWSSKCNWEEDKHKCAQALCEASGYDTGTFIEDGSSNDMCSNQYTRYKSQKFYVVDRGMISSGTFPKNAQIKAMCSSSLGSHCGDGAPLFPLTASECPSAFIEIPACEKVSEGDICQDSAKKCDTADDLNNCGTRTLYRKAPQCSDDYPLIPVTADKCPEAGTLTLQQDCHKVRPGELCEGHGECGTNPNLNNCKYTNSYIGNWLWEMGYSVYKKASVKHSKSTCNLQGRCLHGCVNGSFGARCDTPCPQNCNGLGCDVRHAGALQEGWCKECTTWNPASAIKTSWTGPKCMHQCHHTCMECENWASPSEPHYRKWPKEEDYQHCTICREDQPTKPRQGGTPGMCECIPGATWNTTSEKCECIQPADTDVREAHFQMHPTKQCRHVCKNSGAVKYVEVFGDRKSQCIRRETEKFIQRTMWTKPECKPDDCAQHECNFPCTEVRGNVTIKMEGVCTDPEAEKGYFCILKEYVDYITG